MNYILVSQGDPEPWRSLHF